LMNRQGMRLRSCIHWGRKIPAVYNPRFPQNCAAFHSAMYGI
jgi:hypothetical protein